MIIRILIVIAIILGGLNTALYAQETVKDELFLLARPMPDSIMLRWAPTTYRLWINCNKHGYLIERSCLMRNGEMLSRPERVLLTNQPLKPAPEAQWETMADSSDLAGVAAASIFGEGFEVETADGGMMDVVNQITVQESRFGYALLAADLSADIARLSGLGYTDKNVKKGEKYLYKVYPVSVPEGLIVDTAFFFTGVDEFLPTPVPVNVEVEPGDKMVTLTWDAVSQFGAFSAFWVERSDDEGHSFSRLHSTPMINTTPEGMDDPDYHYYIDSLADNKINYQYRIIGITPFGEESKPSAVVSVNGIDKITVAPHINSGECDDGKTVVLEWEMDNPKNENIEGYRVFRSQVFDTNYDQISSDLLATQRTFCDNNPLSTGYYRIQAFNSDGPGPMGMPKMVQLVDSVPPLAPIGLEAEADTSGLVYLRWQHNSEPDLYGYRVFMANNPNDEFSQLTVDAVYDNFYTDTIQLKTLTKKVYYRILAVDKRQNWSEFSDILEVKRPDIVPPAAPRITAIAGSHNGLKIEWFTSPSDDVAFQLLYRTTPDNKQWQLISRFNPQLQQFNDSTVLAETIYRYLLVAVDSAANESKPSAFVSGKYQEKKKEQWISPKVKVNKKKNEIIISWEGLIEGKNSAGILYRKAQGVDNRWLVYKAVNLEDYQIIIKESVKKAAEFEYVIRVTPN